MTASSLTLAECESLPPEVVGGKTAGLARAHAAGFVVPDALCVPAGVLSEYLAAVGADPSDATGCLAALEKPLPPVLLGALARACGSLLANGSLAVRSSAPVEDAAEASWAGQFTTALGVTTAAQLDEAVRACWRSAFAGPATSYADTGRRMAVLVQQLIPARHAGVAFSVDPLTGREGIAVVEAVPGLGTLLVDGRASPDRFEVDSDEERILVRAPGEHRLRATVRAGEVVEEKVERDAPLDDATAVRAALLARDLQERFGYPVDVEWALDADGRLWLLQVRPLTSITFRPRPGVWTNANFGEVIPGIITALTGSVILEHDYPAILYEFGIQLGLAKRGEQVTDGGRLYGRPYWRCDLIKERLARLPGFHERGFDEGVGIRPTYEGEGRTTGFTPVSIARGLPILLAAKKLFAREHVDAAASLKRFREEVEPAALARDWDSLADDELGASACWAIDERTRNNRMALRATFLADLAQDDLRRVLAKAARRLGEPPSEATLVTGLGELATGRPLKELEALASELRGAPAVARAILDAGSWEAARETLPGVPGGADALARMRALVEAYGYMADADEEFALPRWEDDPSVPFATLVALLSSEPAPRPKRADFESERRRVRGAVSPLSRRGFDTMLERARLYSFWREETRETLARANRICHRVLVVYGRRLAARGVLERDDDVFRLNKGELFGLARGEIDRDAARAAVRRSRRAEASWANFRPPDVLGVEQLPETEEPDGALRGVACSPGVAEGRVAVLRDLAEIGKLQAGDVLVVQFTNPGWTPAFALASALVTEEGGLLSHGSIIARERGLPAVLRVHRATERLHDGEMVRVDGTRGLVVPLGGPARSA